MSLTLMSEDSPRVSAHRRFEVETYGEGFLRVSLHFGVIEESDVPLALSLCPLAELDFGPMRTTYFPQSRSGDPDQARRYGPLARKPVRLFTQERQQRPEVLQFAVESGDRTGHTGRNVRN